MDQQIEERIRARAHVIWEADGRPEGRDLDHWRQAVEDIAAEGTAGAEDQEEGQGQIVAPTPPQGR